MHMPLWASSHTWVCVVFFLETPGIVRGLCTVEAQAHFFGSFVPRALELDDWREVYSTASVWRIVWVVLFIVDECTSFARRYTQRHTLCALCCCVVHLSRCWDCAQRLNAHVWTIEAHADVQSSRRVKSGGLLGWVCRGGQWIVNWFLKVFVAHVRS